MPRGWRGAVSGGMACHRCEGVWYQGLSLSRQPVVWGGRPGFRDPHVPGAVGAGVGTQHRPRSVPFYRPALCAVGVAEGRPQGAMPFAILRGV